MPWLFLELLIFQNKNRIKNHLKNNQEQAKRGVEKLAPDCLNISGCLVNY